MNNQNIQLNIGDKIGFVILANGIDGEDRTIFCPVVGITTRDNETAYFYQYPDGSVSMAAIRQSDLAAHAVQIEAQIPANMICLSERRTEFVEAMNRGKNSDLEVFADFDRDAFVVVNCGNRAEYRVTLETFQNKTYGICECPDFVYRKRVCKHLSAVLVEAFFGIPKGAAKV